MAAVKGACFGVIASDLQRYAGAAARAKGAFGRVEQPGADAQAAAGRQDEEFVDLGRQTPTLEAEHIYREQVTRRIAIDARDPGMAQRRIGDDALQEPGDPAGI